MGAGFARRRNCRGNRFSAIAIQYLLFDLSKVDQDSIFQKQYYEICFVSLLSCLLRVGRRFRIGWVPERFLSSSSAQVPAPAQHQCHDPSAVHDRSRWHDRAIQRHGDGDNQHRGQLVG